MAAKTPSTVLPLGILQGGGEVYKATFTDLDDGDTWASGISGVLGWIFQRTDDPTTQASAGVAVGESSGTFTFYPAEDNTAGDLYIIK